MPTTHRPAVTTALLVLAVACRAGDESHATGGFGSSGDIGDADPPSTETTTTPTGSGSSESDAESTTDDQSGIKLDVAPVHDAGSAPIPEVLSYIWIPNTGNTTVSKVNTVTGVEEARYHTNGGAGGPSSTAINQHGDLLVASTHGPHSLTKIADADCPDRNGDGSVQTSTGHLDVLPWPEDECVLWEVQFPQPPYNYIGAIAWEGGSCVDEACSGALPNPRAWAAWRTADYRRVVVARLDGATGSVLDQFEVQTDGALYTAIPFHGAVNAEGDFWIAAVGGSTESPGGFLIHVDSVTLAASVFPTPQLVTGLAIDIEGDPWIAGAQKGGTIWRFDVASAAFVDIGGAQGGYSGLQFDAAGRLWVSSSSGCSLTVVDGSTATILDEAVTTPNCVQHLGVSVDRNGFVWVVDLENSATGTQAAKVHKVDPVTHETAFMVEGFDFPLVRSDMTGTSLQVVTAPPAG